VELYEQIRREYEFGVGSVIGVARKLGVHRPMVREAVRNAVPALACNSDKVDEDLQTHAGHHSKRCTATAC
jgi:hypothetical protein